MDSTEDALQHLAEQLHANVIATVAEEITWRRGDIAIVNRLSPVQALLNLSGDLMTHSAIVGDVDGELRMIEFGAKGCFSRSIEEFTRAYRVVGQLRPAISDTCRQRMTELAEYHLRTRVLRYSWIAVGSTGIASLTRRLARRRCEAGIVERSMRCARWLSSRIDPRRVTCSGFVSLCLDAACDRCRPALAWPVRTRPAPFRGAPSAIAMDRRPDAPARGDDDRDAVRFLVMPSDLWVAVPARFRRLHRTGHEPTVLIDLRSASAPIHCDFEPVTTGTARKEVIRP